MRELGLAGKPDQPKCLATRDALLGLDRDAAAPEMAVLVLPAVVVHEKHAVAALASLDGFVAALAEVDVRLAVANAADPAGGRGQHIDAAPHGGEVEEDECRCLCACRWPAGRK